MFSLMLIIPSVIWMAVATNIIPVWWYMTLLVCIILDLLCFRS